jgi:hypothetical protein
LLHVGADLEWRLLGRLVGRSRGLSGFSGHGLVELLN